MRTDGRIDGHTYGHDKANSSVSNFVMHLKLEILDIILVAPNTEKLQAVVKFTVSINFLNI
jgi:hypothetical protein